MDQAAIYKAGAERRQGTIGETSQVRSSATLGVEGRKVTVHDISSLKIPANGVTGFDFGITGIYGRAASLHDRGLATGWCQWCIRTEIGKKAAPSSTLLDALKSMARSTPCRVAHCKDQSVEQLERFHLQGNLYDFQTTDGSPTLMQCALSIRKVCVAL